MKAVMRRFISVWIMVSFLMCSAWGTASAGFSDVELTDWFFDGINFVSATNIIEAETETEFGVDRAATRGMVAEDMDVIAEAISLLVKDVDANKEKAMALVKTLTDKYPLYK